MVFDLIRDLAARFSDAVNRSDIKKFGEPLAEDGIWEIGQPFPARATGREQVVNMLKGLRGHWEFFFQMTHSGVIDIGAEGRSATARWQIQEIARSVEGSQSYDNLPMYFDQLVRINDGSWRFAERSYHYVWLSSATLEGRSYPVPSAPAT